MTIVGFTDGELSNCAAYSTEQLEVTMYLAGLDGRVSGSLNVPAGMKLSKYLEQCPDKYMVLRNGCVLMSGRESMTHAVMIVPVHTIVLLCPAT